MDRKQASQFTTGMIVIAIGLMLLASQLNAGWAWDVGRLWPMVFLVLAAGRLLGPGEEGRGSGVWFLFLGVLFLMHTYGVLRLHDSWPLFIVAGGVSMMFRRDRGRRRGSAGAVSGSNEPGRTGDPFGGGRFQP